jgi:radical SAM protein with 4Fe4S-binding SPASM domain
MKKICPVRLNFVIQADNYKELVDYCKLAKKLGVEGSFIPVTLDLDGQPHLPENLAKYDLNVLREQIEGAMKTGLIQKEPAFMKNFFDRTKAGPSPQKCLAPYRCILIFNNGDVYPCGAFDKPVGNLSLDKKFIDIWNNYEGLRKQVWEGKYTFCDKCVYADISNRRTLLSAIAPYLRRRFLKKKQTVNTCEQK